MTEDNVNLLIIGSLAVVFFAIIMTACVAFEKLQSDCIINATQVLQIEKCSH